MKARYAAFAALAVLLSVVFVRLGFWQLDRLAERRAVNARITRQMSEPPVPFDSLRGDTAFRRVHVAGTPDFGNEVIQTGRSRNGSPGVNILTPVLRPGNDTAVLVNRGWVYSADAASADLDRWREQRDSFSGFVMPLDTVPGRSQPSGRRVRALSHSDLQALLPYPVASMYVVVRDSGSADTPARIDPPALNNGPHLSYAIQWFCFALIAIGGAGIVLFRARREHRAGSTAA